MLYLATGHFVVAHQPGEDRQSGGVGRGPGTLTLLIRSQIPTSSGISVPTLVAVDRCSIQFVQKAIAVVDDEHILVTGIGCALDRCVCGYRHRSRIALIAVSREVDTHRA